MGDKAVVVAGDDMGDGLQCADHPYQISPGGICAFCLQDRLGKLVSSSNTDPFFPPTSSAISAAPLAASDTGSTSDGSTRGRSSKIPFLSAAAIHRRHKKGGTGGGYSPYNRSTAAVALASSSTTTTSSSSSNSSSGFVFKRSKSANPRPLGGLAETGSAADSPRKKNFWSFLHLSSAAGKAKSRSNSAAAGADLKAVEAEEVVESPGGSQTSSSSFGRKVSRSRSVGCGSRSFSGDLLERISTGFADCTLRRVESQREAKPKAVAGDERRMKERVKCGGLFGMLSSSSSSSSSWISAAAAADREFDSGRSSVASAARGRGRSWGWAAFASPMRAFKPAASSSNPLVVTTGGGAPATVVTAAGGDPTTVATGGAGGSDIVEC